MTRSCVFAMGLLLAGSCLAQPVEWLTVTGDRTDPAQDTIEVNPIPVSTADDNRTMRIRVSRSVQRTNWDGIPFRSYYAMVEFDCGSKTAQFQQVSYYMQPVWAGEAHKVMSYGKQDPRPMRFRGVTPNPVERIIKAACATSRG